MSENKDFNAMSAKVDEIFAKWNKTDSPGAAVVVLKDGEVVHRKGYGRAHLEYDQLIKPSTIFHVASVSKQFTTMAIALLVQDGLISLDDEVGKYLPYFPKFEHKVTIRHMCHNVSGLRDQWELLMLAGYRMDDVLSLDRIIDLVSHQKKLNFPPGGEYVYSNTGFTLLAEIVAKVSGSSFPQFCQERIFKPIGMERTHFHDDYERIVPDRAYSYKPNPEGGYKKAQLSYANVGATSLFTTVDDMAKWLRHFDTKEVGWEEVSQIMHGRFTLNSGELSMYGFGLMFDEHKGLKHIGHGGADAGYRSWAGRFVEHGLSLVILTNLSTFNTVGLATKIAETYLKEHMVETEKETCQGEPSPLSAYVGKYLVANHGLIVTVSEEEGKLMAEMGQQPKAELSHQGGHIYKAEAIGMSLTFKEDSEGKITGFSVGEGRMRMEARKFADINLSSEALEAYVGQYYSEELHVTWNVKVCKEQLVATQRKQLDTDLIATDEDQFSAKRYGMGKIQFYRNAEDQVMGLRVSGGRVRDIEFVRK